MGNEIKHTPNWKVYDSVNEGEPNYRIDDEGQTPHQVVGFAYDENDAKLIAAAPELLELIKKARLWMLDPPNRKTNVGTEDVRQLIDELTAAIIKATT